MSDIILDFTVNNNNIDFTVESNEIILSPQDVQLSVYAGGYATAAGNTTEVQYNNGGILGASNIFTFNNTTNTLSVTNLATSGNAAIGLLGVSGNAVITGNISGSNNLSITGNIGFASSPNVTLGAIGNIYITGGSNGQSLITNGSGNLSFATIVTNAAGSNTQVQFNNSNAFAGSNSFTFNNVTGTVTAANLVVSNDSNLGNVSNVNILGGINGYYLQTDGAGNLTWATGSNYSGNGTVGGANTQIQYNNAGSFAGNSGFTFNNVTGDIDMPGNVTIAETVKISQALENVTLISAQSGTYNFNVLDGAIRYTTANSTANITLNVRGSSTVTANAMIGSGQSTTVTYLLTNGSTAYGIIALQVDSVAQSIDWVSGVTPAQISNTITSYTFTIIKTSTTPTYTVLGSATRYY
jgi:hypothetical protein